MRPAIALGTVYLWLIGAGVASALGQPAEQGSGVQQHGAHSVTGRVLQANEDTVLVGLTGMKTLPLKVDDATTVLLDGVPTSAAELPPGVEVRAAYDELRGQHVAARLEAKTQRFEDRQRQKPQPGGFPEPMRPPGT